MQDLIKNLFPSGETQDLYLGAIEAVEGVFKKHPKDAWKQIYKGDSGLSEAIENDISASGVLGLGLSEEFGGMGGGFLGSTLVGDLMAQHGLTSFKSLGTPFCRRPIIEHGTEEQIRKYVTPTITGEKGFCICATEPDAGTNTFRITTKAVKTGNKWILNGQKIFISGATTADYGFLIAKTAIDTPGALSIFVIDMNSPGIVKQKQNIDVFTNENQYSVFFDDVELPEDALIGDEGKGARYMFAGLNAERFIVSAICVGISDLALECTKEYVNQRVIFGDKPTGSYQAVQHPLAQSKANTDAARLMLYYGVKLYDEGIDAGVYANSAKLLSSQAAAAMCTDAIQFHGGSGMDSDTGMLALWKVAKTLSIAPVNNEMVLNYISEHVIGLPKSY
ncbi:MAG: acyl-CoA dehydrogenase [Pseudomonadales bacterium]|nr:acyl-CoA dehydrogenase [Pseudomonadales bacterium]